MATNQTGIAITIKAFLPIGKDLDQQLAALTLVKTAHETSDYAPLLAAANIDEVKTEQKTRRVEEAPKIITEYGQKLMDDLKASQTPTDPDGNPPADTAPPDDADIPAFLKGKKSAKPIGDTDTVNGLPV